ncbi:MAG: FtsX-like permease family protein [Oscillospiraceae bacterium]|nr:FtsX-like permease family protein [Oscillospiraceae bacterium]
MKSKILTDTLRKITRAKGRFLALFGIIALSSGFFAGLKVTGPDMKQSAEDYYRKTHLMDLHLMSDIGFNDAALRLLQETEGLHAISPGYSEAAFLAGADDAETIVKLYSMDFAAVREQSAINLPLLTEGEWPDAPNECLIEANTPSRYGVGDTLTVTVTDAETSLLKETVFTVTGRADWSMFVDFNRGTASVGDGSIDSFLLVPAAAFEQDVYTDIYLTLEETQSIDSYSDAYDAVIKRYTELFEDQAEVYVAPRVEQVRLEAAELLTDSRKELDDGYGELEENRQKFADEIKAAEQKLADALQEITDGEADLETGQAEYEDGLAAYEKAVTAVDRQDADLQVQEAAVADALAQLADEDAFLARLQGIVTAYRDVALGVPFPKEIQALIDKAAAYDSGAYSLSDNLTAYFQAAAGSPDKQRMEAAIAYYIDNCRAELTNRAAETKRKQQYFADARATIEDAKERLAGEKTTLDAAKSRLEEAQRQLADARIQYDEGVAGLAEQKAEGEQQLADAEQKLAEGEAEYADAQKEIAALGEDTHLYVFGRAENPGWSSYALDTERVDAIAAVFPLFFILVAALVCLTTMTRMVEEQRTEIGTYRALGYGTASISVQYLLYAAIACVTGVACGTLIGYQVFPKVIFICYQLMYRIPEITCPYRWDYALGCLAVALLCTGITAMIACHAVLREAPSQLMRPKPPKKGKRLFIERWQFLRNKMSFRHKVTLRNFFRYRSRVLMTVIGISGCTALLLTGFGLYHAVSAIVDLQFEEVFRYDAMIAVSDDAVQQEQLAAVLEQDEQVTEYQFGLIRSATVYGEKAAYEINIAVPSQPESFDRFVLLRDRKTHEIYHIPADGAVINEKLAKLLGLSVGDTICPEQAEAALTVTAITENYAGNYIYCTPAAYTAMFGSYEPNILYMNEAAGTDESALAERLLKEEGALAVNFSSDGGDSFRELVGTLSYIVILVVICSGLLALVVLYHLSNINITERMRELATLKVLGFYPREVSAYVARENLLSTVLGTACGLVLGVFLCRFVVQTAEVDVVMFCPDIPVYCFFVAAALTLLFAMLVNLLLRPKLAAIDMAASMKAIE